MSFQNKYLSMMAYCNGFTQWHYDEKEKTVIDVCYSNYFGNVSSLMNVGDIIILNASNGTAYLCVTKIENGKVYTKLMNQCEY